MMTLNGIHYVKGSMKFNARNKEDGRVHSYTSYNYFHFPKGTTRDEVFEAIEKQLVLDAERNFGRIQLFDVFVDTEETGIFRSSSGSYTLLGRY